MIYIYSINELDAFICNNLTDNLNYSNQTGGDLTKNVILLYFGALWCNPCEKLLKTLNDDETKKSMPQLKIGYIDIDNDSDKIADIYKIKIF